MVSLNVLGMNCGTSIDGIDVAHCRISSLPSSADITVQLLSYCEIPVTHSLRTRILALVKPDAPTTLEDVCELNFLLGEEFARAVKASGVDLDEVDLIASHGQTLWHKPTGKNISTLQMAEPAVIANRTKKTVVSNFRTAELAAGRQGAPLSGFFEAAILRHATLTRISQNIGGIGNASVIPALNRPRPAALDSSYFAFDSGPGNVLIDATVRLISQGKYHYDKDGEAGARGVNEIDAEAVEEFLQKEYFMRKPPKTTGRELFSDDLARELIESLRAKNVSDDGIVATITRMTSESIVRAYSAYVIPLVGHIDELYICGGGAFNPNILSYLGSSLPHTKVRKMGEATLGLSAEAKEAVLFAVLGFLGLCGRSVPIAGFSERREKAVLGAITPGGNYRELLERVVRDDGEFGKKGILGRIIMQL
ncbi:hypothetical protein O988_00705 [Pseudogymnoascus sp. VKM F-3808]|nr:hypothetical protein O988_00705 [Pseudogymnoascus sp. VKM F-3808]